MNTEEILDNEISSLFKDARDKLEAVSKDTEMKKKDIIVTLAQSLDGKIQTDTICIEIVNQLREKVSERFVRQCLDEKYKQKSRVHNAKKQKSVDIVAALPPLNDREVVFVDSMTGSTTQESMLNGNTEDQNNDTKSHDFDCKDYPKLADINKSTRMSLGKGQGLGFKLADNPSKLNLEKGCPHCNELAKENLELKEALKKSEQFVIANNLLKDDVKMTNNEMSFELQWSFRELRIFMEPLFSKGDDSQQVWFNGTIDMDTRKIISSGFGRLIK